MNSRQNNQSYSPYFGGWLETAPRAMLLEWQWGRLVEHVDWLERRCPFWQAKFSQAGASAADLRTIEDFRRLPTTDKHEQAVALEEAGAKDSGGLLCRPIAEIRQNGAFIWHTTGTTGRQRVFITSFSEFERISVRATSRVLWMGQIRPGDMFGILAPATFWIAGLALNYACRNISVTPLLLGPPLDTAGKLEMLRRHRPAGVFMTPTFAPRLLEVAAERGIDMRSLGTRSVLLGGEVATPEARHLIESEWRPERGVYDMGGLSETNGFTYGECERRDGMHVFEDLHHADVVDPDDPSRPVAPGQVGELVMTSFSQRDLIAAFRFRTNDLVTYTDALCSCGRAYRRIRYAGRKDDMRTVGGVNIFPGNVEAVVRRSPGLGGEFRLATPARNDFLRARVEAARDAAAPAFVKIGAQLHEALKLALGINVRVEVLPFGQLDRFEGKARRWEEF